MLSTLIDAVAVLVNKADEAIGKREERREKAAQAAILKRSPYEIITNSHQAVQLMTGIKTGLNEYSNQSIECNLIKLRNAWKESEDAQKAFKNPHQMISWWFNQPELPLVPALRLALILNEKPGKVAKKLVAQKLKDPNLKIGQGILEVYGLVRYQRHFQLSLLTSAAQSLDFNEILKGGTGDACRLLEGLSEISGLYIGVEPEKIANECVEAMEMLEPAKREIASHLFKDLITSELEEKRKINPSFPHAFGPLKFPGTNPVLTTKTSKPKKPSEEIAKVIETAFNKAVQLAENV